MPDNSPTPTPRTGLSGTFYVDTPTAARLLDCTTTTIRSLIDEGKLRAFRLRPRGFWHIERASIEELKQRGSNMNTAPDPWATSPSGPCSSTDHKP